MSPEEIKAKVDRHMYIKYNAYRASPLRELAPGELYGSYHYLRENVSYLAKITTFPNRCALRIYKVIEDVTTL